MLVSYASWHEICWDNIKIRQTKHTHTHTHTRARTLSRANTRTHPHTHTHTHTILLSYRHAPPLPARPPRCLALCSAAVSVALGCMPATPASPTTTPPYQRDSSLSLSINTFSHQHSRLHT